MKLKTLLTTVFGMLVAGVAVAGDLEVSAYWQDHMILQRNKRITVWGKDAVGRTVTVSFAGQTVTATPGADGIWETTFAQPFALSTTPQTLTITDNAGESLTRSDILVGDVYLAGGQSNMDRFLTYKQSYNEPQSVFDFCKDDDGIRFIRIAKTCERGGTVEDFFNLPPIKPADATIQYYGDGHDWAAATGEDRKCVSSVALNFAHYIRNTNREKGLDIPIGIIHASVGGSSIRNWMSPATIRDNDLLGESGWGVSGDSWYWDEMIAPILRAKICAILWYQGCSDAEKSPDEYKHLMDILVRDWRGRWGENSDLPFYAVQIGTPGYGPSTGTIGLDQYPAPTLSALGSNYVRVREAQRLWDRADTGTHGLVTIVDCVKCMGDGDLHPNDKNFVGRRLSLFARKDLYGEADLQTQGPVYTRAVREANGTVRLHFKPGTARGLTAGKMKQATDIEVSRWLKTRDEIRGFALCGTDGVWKDAVATAEGETLVLRADGITSPTKFHYGYWSITRSSELDEGQRLNLYNEAELPMSPVAPQTIEDPNASAKVAEPVLSPASCYFSPSTNVTIACATTGATIRYTLDGSEPTATSAAYSAPITLSATTTIKARAFVSGKEASDVVLATYTLGEVDNTVKPDPRWTTGAYVPAEWRKIGANLLANAVSVTYEGGISYICSKDLSKLTDGQVPLEMTNATAAGSQTEVVGFQQGSAAIWTFAAPVSIGKLRISTRWINTTYDAITVQDVYVKKGDEWVALNVPVSHKSGIASITTGALEATLADEGLGYLALNVTGLKIVFGAPESAVANYYAEIEAVGTAAGSDPGPGPEPEPGDDDGPTDPEPGDGDDEGDDPEAGPTGESARTWTSGDYDPAAWAPLANNIIAGSTPVATDTSKISFAASKDLSKLTDGAVSASAATTEIVGLCPDAELTWTFAEAQVIEKIRFSSLWSSTSYYAGINVKDILVKTSGSSEWVSLDVSFSRSGTETAGGAQYATLSDPGLGYLALDVVALKVVAGAAQAYANYYGEIEVVGKKSSESASYPPALGGLKVTPWGESVEFSGSVLSVGTGASACDLYLAVGSDADHLGTPVKIHSGNAGAFHYELKGLSRNTTYAYRLTASNNAATPAGCTESGTFATTSEIHPEWSAYKWAAIGDSLTDPTLLPLRGNFYYDFVCRDTGIQLVYLNGVGSTGYKNKHDVEKAFYQRLLAEPLPSDVDVVTIFGSVNDWGQVRTEAEAGSPSDRLEDGKDTLAAYMNKAIDVIQAQAPGAKIILAGSLYYYNVVAVAHARANDTLRAVAAARGVAYYDWLTEKADDPLDFHQIADDPTAEGSFAQRYARDCPTTIVPGETSFGHPSAAYHEEWLSPHFRGILTEALSSVTPVPPSTPVTLQDPAARPSTDYNGSTVSVSFTGDVPEGAVVSAKVTIDGEDYTGTVGEGVVTFAIPSDAVVAGNVYTGTVTLTVDGVNYTKPVTLEQGTFKVDANDAWIAESATTFGTTGAWSGEVAQVKDGAIAVSNALFTAETASPADAVVTLTSTFAFKGASDEDFNPAAQAGVKVVKVGQANRYAFLTGTGVVTNTTVAAEVSRPVSVTVTVDKVANTVAYSIGDTAFGPFAGDAGKGALSKVRYTGATEVSALDGSYRAEFLDANLAAVGGTEYATVADALAANAGAVTLLWDASWAPAAAGDYNITTNGHALVIGGTLAYQVKDNGDGTITVSVAGGETPVAPTASAIAVTGNTVTVAVTDVQAGLWYTLEKTTDLTKPFVVASDAKWVAGAALIAGTDQLTIALGEGETAAFYRVVVSETNPTQK